MIRAAASNRSYQDATRPLGFAVCLLLWSCSQPRYEEPEDASVAPAREAGSPIMMPMPDAGTIASSDASTPIDAKVDGESLLLGNYAIRVRYHAKQPSPGLFKQSEEAYLLADVQRIDGKLELHTQVCEQHSVSTSTVGANVNARISYPEYIPARAFELVVEGGTFHTEGPASEIGYQSAAVAGCSAGATIAADEPWRTNARCTCPSSDAPPTSSADCRVSDSDRDQHPGMTVRFSGVVERTDYVRRRDASQLISGSIASDKRHTAQYQTDQQNYVFDCQGSGCGSGQFIDCPAGQNRVLFAPLAARAASGFSYTCADVLREIEAGQLFAADPLAFPPGC